MVTMVLYLSGSDHLLAIGKDFCPALIEAIQRGNRNTMPMFQ